MGFDWGGLFAWSRSPTNLTGAGVGLPEPEPPEKVGAPGNHATTPHRHLEDVGEVPGEEGGGEALLHLVVDGYGLLQVLALHHVHNRGKRLSVQDGGYDK